ncbi:fimbrial protein FaeI [Escherichia coli]|uniref:F4 family fimbrial subunit n=1 Tax=Escherichia coli TaxID=562 RepID=UPI0010CB9F7F|nr:fimbrial protein [Escherichia coli]GCU67640.1 fimbrial protein FaeI [Escherichia coli]GCZ35198.1 fimbrial protein FaeI [Escherichia coli]
MKKVTLLLLVVSLLSSGVLAWNTPGEDFSGELNLEGTVTSTRNPWIWKVGEEKKSLEIQLSPEIQGQLQTISVPLPSLTVLLGKTTYATPTGREGLSPRVSYGSGSEGEAFVWTAPGRVEVTLPVTGENNTRIGTFVFKMQIAGVLRHIQAGQAKYAGIYNDFDSNGLPEKGLVMEADKVPGTLQMMFGGEGPGWLQDITIASTTGVSRFQDGTLRQVEGVYGAQILAGSGELHLLGAIPGRWRVSLPVNIDYQ